MDELQLIEKLLPQMAEIMNILPGDEFRMKDSDTLLILQRRMKKSDLCMELCAFNEIFAEKGGCSLHKICVAAVAYVKIRLLADRKQTDFNKKSQRMLVNEFKVCSTRIENIIHLSEVNVMTASDYQKEKIELTLEKQKSLLEAFHIEIEALEKEFERMPVDEKEEEIAVTPPEKEKPEETSVSAAKSSMVNPFRVISKRIQKTREKQVIDEQLKEVEKEQSETRCGEIPFYDKSLTFTEDFVCKDIPAYSILKRRNNYYFGLTGNISKNVYDNADTSLMELTEANEEFLQFMTEDLLSEEYELSIFSVSEKEALKMYFNFVTGCFKKHIGVTITVQEYLAFKGYYNRLVLKMFELEKKQKEDYYKALILADAYVSYMEGYDLKCVDDEETIIANIVKEKYGNYIDDLNLIMDNHICDEVARADLEELKRKIIEFNKPEKEAILQETTPEAKEILSQEAQVYQIPQYAQIPQMFGMPVMPMNMNQGIMQVVIQILNKDREVVDEALYAGNNIGQALYDYQSKNGFIKRLGFRNNGQDIFCKEEKEMV